MRDPGGYFNDPIEKELALEAWKVGGKPDTDPAYTWYQPHTALYDPRNDAFANQLIAARNWITAMRDQPSSYWGETIGGVGRVKAYFKELYGKDFLVSNAAIGNVEHFYTSALITGVFGQFFIVGAAGTALYEVILQPLAVGLWNTSFTAGWNNLKNNWKQLTGPNKDGASFVLMNSRYSQIDVQKFFNVDPEVVEPGASRPKPPVAAPPPAAPVGGNTVEVKKGQSLSLIARDLYKSVELWPLLWDENKSLLPNPNKTKPGMVLKYKDIKEYSPAQITDAKQRSPSWRNYPT